MLKPIIISLWDLIVLNLLVIYLYKHEMESEIKTYLKWRCRVNWHNKYHKYIDEWISNVTQSQLQYFRKEMIYLRNNGIYQL